MARHGGSDTKRYRVMVAGDSPLSRKVFPMSSGLLLSPHMRPIVTPIDTISCVIRVGVDTRYGMIRRSSHIVSSGPGL